MAAQGGEAPPPPLRARSHPANGTSTCFSTTPVPPSSSRQPQEPRRAPGCCPTPSRRRPPRCSQCRGGRSRQSRAGRRADPAEGFPRFSHLLLRTPTGASATRRQRRFPCRGARQRAMSSPAAAVIHQQNRRWLWSPLRNRKPPALARVTVGSAQPPRENCSVSGLPRPLEEHRSRRHGLD